MKLFEIEQVYISDQSIAPHVICEDVYEQFLYSSQSHWVDMSLKNVQVELIVEDLCRSILKSSNFESVYVLCGSAMSITSRLAEYKFLKYINVYDPLELQIVINSISNKAFFNGTAQSQSKQYLVIVFSINRILRHYSLRLPQIIHDVAESLRMLSMYCPVFTIDEDDNHAKNRNFDDSAVVVPNQWQGVKMWNLPHFKIVIRDSEDDEGRLVAVTGGEQGVVGYGQIVKETHDQYDYLGAPPDI